MTPLDRQPLPTPGGREQTVGDVLVHRPRTLPADARIAAVRAAFADDHVHMLLLTEGDTLVGTLLRDDLEAAGGDDVLAVELATLVDRTVSPDVPAEQARRWLVARGLRRLAVVEEDGTLLGLLCLKRRLTGFCSDADVAARAAEGLERAAAGPHVLAEQVGGR